MTEAIGMMEGAFFVGRTEILNWINEFLKLDLVKIEQTASGAVACQIMDALYPGTVPMHKVNWKATQEYEFINNYKILQQAFLKQKIAKVIEVEKLSKGKYQDNLEFMQWLKRYYDLNANKGISYDPIARRKNANLPPSGAKPPKTHPKTKLEKPESAGSVKPAASKKSPEKEKYEEMKEKAETFKTERDFYFGKLRNIESLLDFHGNDGTPFVDKIKKIQ